MGSRCLRSQNVSGIRRNMPSRPRSDATTANHPDDGDSTTRSTRPPCSPLIDKPPGPQSTGRHKPTHRHDVATHGPERDVEPPVPAPARARSALPASLPTPSASSPATVQMSQDQRRHAPARQANHSETLEQEIKPLKH